MSETPADKPHFTLNHIEELSVWEVSHRYWGYNPDETAPKCLPLDVQDLAREMLLSNGLGFYDEEGNEFLDVYIAFDIAYPRLGRIKKQVAQRVFNKALLDRIFVEKDDFAKWIIDNRRLAGVDLELPKFWFSPHDIEYFEEEYGEKYTEATPTPNNGTGPAESQQTRAALTRHAGPHKIKLDFIRYWLKEGYQPGQEKIAATAFYKTLSNDDKRLIAPSSILKNAIRTLNRGLQAYLKKESPPPPFLDGFEP